MRTFKLFLQISLGFLLVGASILVFSYDYGWTAMTLIVPIGIQIWLIRKLELEIKGYDSLVHSVDKLESTLVQVMKQTGYQPDFTNNSLPATQTVHLEYLVLIDGVYKNFMKTLAIPRRYYTLDEIVLHVKDNLSNYDLPLECKIIAIERK